LFLIIFTISEVENVIKGLKTGKVSKSDILENDSIKLFKRVFTEPICLLANKIFNTEEIPKQWSKPEITIIHKNGDKTKLDTYRPISITTDMSKLFMKVLKNRIYNKLDENQPPEQAGFRRGFSTTDHLHTIN